MKRPFLVLICIFLLSGMIYANVGNTAVLANTNGNEGSNRFRETPQYTFSTPPISLMTSYYDYMIGGFNNHPIRVIPASAGGGYFLTYHGQRNAVGPRRVFYAHLDETGSVINFNEISGQNIAEGFSAMAIDPVSGKPLYAWQTNADADPELEVKFSSDAFITGISGLFNPVQTIVDSPIAIFPPAGGVSIDNEFILPTLQIGPSPIAGMRRAYVLTRNAISHTIGASQNVWIVYADFNGSMIEDGSPLEWNPITIPELDQWNHDANWRSPHLSLAVDNLGNLYYVGYHTATQAGTNDVILEPDFDVFMCDNYGQGTWSRISEFSHMASWNPQASPAGSLYFTDQNGTPFAHSELFWALTNSSNLNAVTDNYGRIIMPGIWALRNSNGGLWEEHHVIKSVIYNPAINNFTISEIYPQKDPADDHNQAWTPWDTQAPWGVPEYVQADGGGYALKPQTIYPFPHWDSSLHGQNMIHNYNNIKISEVNTQGMMVAVWQDSQRAKWANEGGGTEYLPYVQAPEIFISVSANQGESWSMPIVLNRVETPEFSNIKPMWVYPADKVKYMGSVDGLKVGRIGLMFFNDYTWGANALNPPAHPTNNGGQVMFTELEIVFPEAEYEPTDPWGEPVILSSSMSLMASVIFDDVPAAEGDVLAAFVDVAGEKQLRGKAILQSNDGVTGCLMQIFTELNNETIYFQLWVAAENEVYEVLETVNSVVNGSIGSWPDNLFVLHAIGSVVQEIDLHMGWNMFSLNVHPQDQFIISIFGDDYSSASVIKSLVGVHMPNNPFNTLHVLADGDGYFANMTAPATLEVRGSVVPVENPIPLAPGWNLVAYYPQVEIPAYHATLSVAGQLIQLKGEDGLYEPGNPFSTLNIMKPGEAYWLKMSGHSQLIYPSGSRTENSARKQSIRSEQITHKANSQSVLLDISAVAVPGDIINAWVGDEKRGTGEVLEVNGRVGALLQIFTDKANEEISFVLQSGTQSLALEPGMVSEPGAIIGSYADDSYYALDKKNESTPQLVTGLGAAYPNPFKTSATITLNVGKDSGDIKVSIYNVRGQKISTLLSGKQDAGSMNLVWDGLDSMGRRVPTGLYFCRLESASKKQNIKLMLIK